MDESQLIGLVFGMLHQIKLFHWATTSFSKHKALDDLHATLSDKTDLLVESYIGRFKKQPLKPFTVNVSAHSDTSKMEKYIESERDKLGALCDKVFSKAPELQNIIQEIMAEMDKTLYLLKLS